VSGDGVHAMDDSPGDVPAAPGGLLIFPSWLYHGVDPNLTDTPRVSLSFNFRLQWTANL